MSDLRIAALIMAAGESSRFGGCKHLAQIGGTSMLQSAINRVCGLVTETFVVTGAWHGEIVAALQGGESADVSLICNSQWRRGLGCSIAVGVGEINGSFDGVLILLADQVAVSREDIEALIAHFDGENIVCGFYCGRRGVPAIFGAPHFARLQTLDGDKGARSLLNSGGMPIAECPMPRAGVDVDTRQALEDWRVSAHPPAHSVD